MTAPELLERARRAGADLNLEDGRLRLRSGASLPPELCQELRTRVGGLVALLDLERRSAAADARVVASDAEPVRQDAAWSQRDPDAGAIVLWVHDLDYLEAHPELLQSDGPVLLRSEAEALLRLPAEKRAAVYRERLGLQRREQGRGMVAGLQTPKVDP